MIDKSIIQTTSSWPFVEARKLVKERQKIYEKKGIITLQTGYGPSGLPHIGTFAVVARTTMMVNAIKQIIDIPTEIITFSDDMDGLRKIPDNISLLCSPKLLNLLNGSGILVNGLCKFFFKISLFGILSGIFLNPSMSSEKAIISVGMLIICFIAFTIIVVLATSAKVPMCGKPLGP